MSFPRDMLNTLLERVAADDTPLSHVDEEVLEKEVAYRVASRKRTNRSPGDNPVAKWAGASSQALAERRKQADQRRKRVAKIRRARRDAQRSRDAAAAAAAAEQAKKYARKSNAKSSSSTRSNGPRRPRSIRKDPKIAAHYKTLNLPYGAEFDEVKKAYRTLMRKYHPDLHGGSDKKQKAATELSVRVTQAYNELEQYFADS